MRSSYRIVLTAIVLAAGAAAGQEKASTRIIDPKVHARIGSESYPYRSQLPEILKVLDLRPGDVVVDVGAGDGWWSERFADKVGPNGIVHAAEVEQKKVDEMKKKYEKKPQLKPYLCPSESTGLPEKSCDLAFFSQSYHHLKLNSHVDYLRHLRKVIRPSGRICIIEKYPDISTRGRDHGTPASQVVKQAEEAGWIPLRYELMTGTYHYLIILAQRDLFPPEPEPKPAKPAVDKKKADEKPAADKKKAEEQKPKPAEKPVKKAA